LTGLMLSYSYILSNLSNLSKVIFNIYENKGGEIGEFGPNGAIIDLLKLNTCMDTLATLDRATSSH